MNLLQVCVTEAQAVMCLRLATMQEIKLKIKKRGMLAECEGLSLARVNYMSFILTTTKPTEFEAVDHNLTCFLARYPRRRQDYHFRVHALVLAGNPDQKPGPRRQGKVNTFRRH